MKNKKVRLKFFTIPEYEKEQEYLRLEHQKGWKFTNITFLICYHFEKCIPEDVVYQLDYNKDGIAEKSNYIRIFQDCGWEYLLDFVGYSYFRKPVSQMNGEEEIFCDDSSKLDMANRVFKGRMIPLLILFFSIIMPQLLLRISHVNNIPQFILWVFISLFALYLWIFISFGIQYRRLYRKVHG